VWSTSNSLLGLVDPKSHPRSPREPLGAGLSAEGAGPPAGGGVAGGGVPPAGGGVPLVAISAPWFVIHTCHSPHMQTLLTTFHKRPHT
jgi:hypothetical protein